VYGDWVGLVEEVFEMALIETSTGGLRRVCDVGSNLSVGPVSEAVREMLMERTGGFLASFLQQDLRTVRLLSLFLSLSILFIDSRKHTYQFEIYIDSRCQTNLDRCQLALQESTQFESR